MKVDLAKKSLLGKAQERPDLVRQVIQKAKTEGIMNTLTAVRAKLEALVPLGYSASGVVVSKKALGFARRAGKVGHMADEYLAEALFQTGDATGAVAAIDQALTQVAAPGPGEKASRSRQVMEEARARYSAGVKTSKK